MKYNIEVLKKMIAVYDSNIKMFSKYNDVEKRLAEMVYERRIIGAMIENNGEPFPNVPFDNMLYSANKPNADTSWWTKGT